MALAQFECLRQKGIRSPLCCLIAASPCMRFVVSIMQEIPSDDGATISCAGGTSGRRPRAEEGSVESDGPATLPAPRASPASPTSKRGRRPQSACSPSGGPWRGHLTDVGKVRKGCTIPQCDRASQMRGMRVMCAPAVVAPLSVVADVSGRPDVDYSPRDGALGHRARRPCWKLPPNRVEMSKKWLFSSSQNL